MNKHMDSKDQKGRLKNVRQDCAFRGLTKDVNHIFFTSES